MRSARVRANNSITTTKAQPAGTGRARSRTVAAGTVSATKYERSVWVTALMLAHTPITPRVLAHTFVRRVAPEKRVAACAIASSSTLLVTTSGAHAELPNAHPHQGSQFLPRPTGAGLRNNQWKEGADRPRLAAPLTTPTTE